MFVLNGLVWLRM